MNAKSEHKKTEFSKRLTAILNHGALNLAMAIGYRSRLFDVMDEFESPKTASAIAAEAGFKTVQVLKIPDDPFNLHFLCRKT
jgi:hypothetical protein